MTGHAMPWNHDPSGQEKEDAQRARDLAKKQQELLNQQEQQMTTQKKKLNTQQIGMLRARFGVSGAATNSSPQTPLDSAGSLFSRITGRE